MKKSSLCKTCKNCKNQFETIDKRSIFCSHSCSSKYHNSKRAYPINEYRCEKCNTSFVKSNVIKKGRRIHCDDCKRIWSPKTNPKSIKELSSRTISKILKRMKMECSSCGWNKCMGDLHHIIHRENGGTDDHSNLTYLCPNCHREIHSDLSVPYKTLEEHIGDNWKNFYNNHRNCRLA